MKVIIKTGPLKAGDKEEGDVVLASPVQVSVSDEIIWSSNTGRSTNSGKMIGDVIAEKKTIDVEWGVLTATEMGDISKYLKSGFYDVAFYDNGKLIKIKSYRGTLKKEYLGYIGGVHYYKSASVSIIQQ